MANPSKGNCQTIPWFDSILADGSSRQSRVKTENAELWKTAKVTTFVPVISGGGEMGTWKLEFTTPSHIARIRTVYFQEFWNRRWCWRHSWKDSKINWFPQTKSLIDAIYRISESMKALGCHVMLCVQVGGEGIGGVVLIFCDLPSLFTFICRQVTFI